MAQVLRSRLFARRALATYRSAPEPTELRLPPGGRALLANEGVFFANGRALFTNGGQYFSARTSGR
eukprot:7166251-Alexandrium_andersonii.AAC.1